MKGRSLLFENYKKSDLPNGLSRNQRNRIERGYRKINDHLTIKDLDGAIRDIKGIPIRDGNGIPYQHYKEVDDAINGLIKDRDSLKISIENPNMSPEIKKTINEIINEFDIKINNWSKIKEGNAND